MEKDNSNSRSQSPKEMRVNLTPEIGESSGNPLVITEELSEKQEARSSSLECEKGKNDKNSSTKSPNNSEDSFEYPDSESARNKLISEALQKEDEFLEYLMSLPAAVGASKDKIEPPKQLMRSTSTYAGNTSSGGGPKVGLDHLDNLCKLMEQLGDLREQNSKLQRRVQYLEDLKNLQEMHKQLQEDSKQRHLPTKFGHRHRYSSINTSDKQGKRMNENDNYSGSSKVEFPENKNDSYNKRNLKCKSVSNSRTRQSGSHNQQRERSRSVGIDELKADTEKSDSKHAQRRSVEGVAGKGKVSKWTKVKEAFRWEKAAVADGQEDGRFLRVPPVSADGDSSSAGSSGHSPVGDYPLVLPLSSSSSSEDFDLDINFADILAELGPQRSASATDSTGGRLVHDARRLSLSNMPEEEDASRRSKSLDGDATIGSVLINRNYSTKDVKGKAHKTPWGKVKNIIQTRKDSLKKRHRKGDHSVTSDHEDDIEPPPLIDPADGEGTSPESLVKGRSGKSHSESGGDSPGGDSSKRHHCKLCLGGGDCKTSRRLTPMLTLTLPSSEELRSIPTSSGKPPPSPQTDDRHHKTSTVSKSSSHSPAEEPPGPKHDYCKRQTSSSAGTSPPVHRRGTSKWTKVKKAFLTSAPGRREEDGSGRISNSVPSSPSRNSSFLYEVDPDEVDSGDAEDSLHHDPSRVKAEIQRNYEELQQKLSLEFHKKLNEWEHIKSASSTAVPSTGASRSGGSASDDGYLHHGKGFRRKMEEWERIKSSQGSTSITSKNRDSLALQPLEDLSPDFRKKLQEWEKMKNLPTGRDDAPVPPHFKKRIAEWQLWRSKEPSDEVHRRTQEWERMRSLSASSSADNADSGERSSGSGGKTPSPGVARKSTGSTRKATPRTEVGAKRDPIVAPTKCHHKVKVQKEKELQWLDKELQKIEREKLRLEREREKFLEREARLEKMRLAMGSGTCKQEVLIPTSTGLFRFQGISEKFTKRLYEWEKARGIRPEASTFALLDPGYKPPVGAGIKVHPGAISREVAWNSRSSIDDIPSKSVVYRLRGIKTRTNQYPEYRYSLNDALREIPTFGLLPRQDEHNLYKSVSHDRILSYLKQ